MDSDDRIFNDPTEKGFLKSVIDAMVSDGYGIKVWKATRSGSYNCIAIGIVSVAVSGGYRAQAIIFPQPKNYSCFFEVQRDMTEYAYFRLNLSEI